MTAYTRTEGQIAAEITAVLHLLTGRWVSLADVRPHLSRWRRADQDNTLQKMALTREAKLAATSDPKSLTPEDRAAAVVVGGRPKHLIWIPE